MNWKLYLIPLLLIVSNLYGQDTSEVICRPRSEFQQAIIKFKQLDDCRVERDTLISLNELYQWQNNRKDSLLFLKDLRIESDQILIDNRNEVIGQKDAVITDKDRRIKLLTIRFRIAEVAVGLSVAYLVYQKIK